MGVLDFLRGKKKKKKQLPLPTPVTPVKKPITTDIPPIKPPVKEPLPPPKPLPPIEKVPKPQPKPEPKKIEPAPVPKKKAPEPGTPPIEQVHKSKDLKHIFVSSNEYAAVIEKTNVIRAKLQASDEVIQKLSQLQSVEQKELQKWQDQLEGLEKKLTYMETVLAKSGEA